MDWDKVVGDIAPRLFRYFCVRFSKEQSEDLTQETLIRLIRKVQDNKFNPDKGTLRMLSFGIAHYVALEEKQIDLFDSIDEWTETLISDVDLEKLIISNENICRIQQNIKMLSDIEQQVLSLVVDEDLTLSEIGRILKIPEGTVKSHLFRAKKKLIILIQKERRL